MDVRPIISALGRHRTASALIVLEIALTCAILCNALFLVQGRLVRMDRPSGLAEDEVLRVQVAGIGRDDNPEALTRADLAALRGLPGVRFASVANQVTFGESGWGGNVNLLPDQQLPTLNASLYLGDRDLLDALGLQLVEGRRFTADEFVQYRKAGLAVGSVIIPRALAHRLYPGEPALGRTFYVAGQPVRIVGIVAHLARPGGNGMASDAYEDSVLLPVEVPYSLGGHYVLRTEPGRRAEVLAAAVAALERTTPNRVILRQETLEDMRRTFYRQDRAMAWLLVAICVALPLVSALGIVGLASFWVQQRTRQIGVRRALGATRRQILHYFQLENFLLVTMGILLGILLAYAANLWLMRMYELPRLPLAYLPCAALLLWMLGQIAVLGPALRAAAVPPAVATRSA